MKTPHTLYSRLALITSLTLVTGYAFVYAYTNLTLSDADSGKPLTSTLMQTIMGNVNELNTRVNSLASGWGNLWNTGALNSINYTAGMVGIGSTAGTNAELQIKSGTKPHWGIYQDETTEELRFWNGSNRVVFGSGGKVGIGTSSPSGKLTLWESTASAIQELRMDGNNSSIHRLSWDLWNKYLEYSQANGSISFTNATTSDFVIKNTGNVGIGTATPNRKLTVADSAATMGMSIVSTDVNGRPSIDFRRNTSTAIGTIQAGLTDGFGVNGDNFFIENPVAGGKIILRDSTGNGLVQSAGNVGIGTTSTPGRLTIFANPQTIKPLYIQTIDDNNGATKNPLDWNYVPGIIIGNDWSGNAATVNSTKIAKIVLYTAAGGYNNGASIHVEGAGGYDQGQLIFSTGWNSSALATERMRINTLGYVGIWVPSPTYRLQLPNTASVAWQWQANAWVTYSDGRVKTDKETLRYGISEIMKMDPKQYVHHSSEFQSWSLVVTSEWMHTIGFIAQELEKIIPEAVNKPKDDSKELWSVDYNKLVPILVNAMKELKKENDSLKSRLDALEQR